MKTCRYCLITEDKIPFIKGKNQCRNCYNKKFRDYYRDNKAKRQDNINLVNKKKPDRKKANRELVCSNCHRIRTFKRMYGIDVYEASK